MNRRNHFLSLNERKKHAGCCYRCGRIFDGEGSCQQCREKRRVKVPIAAIIRRVESNEIAIARLQLARREQYEAGYKAGYRAGQRAERKARFADTAEISKQELAGISHAYAQEL